MSENDMTINGLRIHYTDNGEGDRVIILMHGWGCDHTTLASIERVALSEGWRVVNIDFPGFGQSQEPPEAWGVEKYTDVVEQLIGRLGITNPVLLGHSFGGRVGIVYSSRNPDNTRALILVDAAGIKPHRSLSYYIKVYTFKLIKRFIYLTHTREKADEIMERRRAKKGSADYASASPMMRRVLSVVVNEDLTPRLSSIKAPTLLIWGVNDTATPIGDAHKMEKLIPDAGLVEMEGCGHYSFLDNPGQFVAVLKSFLNSIKKN